MKVHRLFQVTPIVLTVICLFAASKRLGADSFVPRKEDRICLIGNTLAERMQHDGWLETLLQHRFPNHRMVTRNLGFSADELTVRQRTEGFGSQDEHLTAQKADVIFAFFGFNESFSGPEGIDKFRSDLEKMILHFASQKYNGRSAPRVVLFSPIAHEDLGSPNLPDGSGNNRNLLIYAETMGEVAAKHGVPFVDLFRASLLLYATSAEPLTINGIHLNTEGNRLIAQAIDRALFGPREIDWGALDKLRHAVMDKNFYWFNRYHATDGYNVYGGRSHLKFVDDITNRQVLMREMEILEAMAALRDRRVWAIAQGGDLTVDDSQTPEFISVKSNKPGPGPGGAHLFLSGEAAIEKMKLADGMKVNLVASEERFPDLVNPVQMAFDTKGRLWVAAWPTYPHWQPKQPMNDKLLILEDDDADGKADRCIAFAEDLHNPTGFEFWNGGVIVAQGPDLLFLTDTNGDDRADTRVRILHGLSTADTHHAANSFVFDPGGALYFQEGVFHQSQVETIYGPVRNRDACVWRLEPLTWKVERYIPFNFANPHGHIFTRWGQGIVVDGTGSDPYHDTLFSGHLSFPRKHARPPTVYNKRTRPCPAIEILSSSHFPESNQGNLLVGNVIGFLGILQYRIEEEGGSLKGTEVEPILQSSDENFRPSDIEMGPDGAIWFTDWQNPIIGHMQHHLRDPSRDHQHGRVYRVTYPDRPLSKPPGLHGAPIARLLDVLKEPEDRLRYRAKIELSARDTGAVMTELRNWIEDLDAADPDHAHHLLEALWLHQYHNVVNADLLKRVLRVSDARARAAATRVVGSWRDRLTNPLDLLADQIQDEAPMVRLEAVRACSFFPTSKAADVALLILEKPMDRYLQFTLDATMKQLDQFLK